LDNYWNSFEDRSKEKIFDSSYMTGTPNENSQCLFNYNSKGAVTSCMYDNLIIHVIIFDEHGEHYTYDTENLILDETEITSRISGEILKKISYYKNDKINSHLNHVLQKDSSMNSINQVQTVPKSIELEKSVLQGVQNFSCIRDDFGLITISGQYFNDNLKHNQVDLTISFLDKEDNILGETSTIFYDLKEFESKRFVGHSKWNENFYSCQISIE
jgi:ketopantoate reductase